MAAFGDGNAIRTGLEYFSTATSFTPADMIKKNWLDAFKDSRVAPGAGSDTMTALCTQLFGANTLEGGTSPAALSTFEGVYTERLLPYYIIYPVSCLQNIDRPTLSTLVGLDIETRGADNEGRPRTDAQRIAETSALLNKLPATVQFGFHDNLYKPRDYNSDLITIHGPGAIMDPFGRTAPYAPYSNATKDGSTVWWTHGNLDAYGGLELRLWRNLGFQTLNKVDVAITNANNVTVNVVTAASDVTYTMNIRGEGATVNGVEPDPNPFDGNTVKNTWLRTNGYANMPVAQNLVLYKEALGDTKQVIDAKLFLGSNIGSGSLFTSDEVVALMCLFSGIPVVTAILKNKQDPTKELHQGMLHLPLSGSAIPDPNALKQGFIDMCKAYNDKQLAVIDACLTKPAGTYVAIKGTDDTDIPPNYKTMMQGVTAFARSVLEKLQAVASTLSVPEFKKLCVSSYLVNLVTKTSTKFKINQYTSLLKSNRAFAAILGELKPLDPLATMVAGGASSRKRSRKTRRSRRRTSAQRGGSYEFAATRAGFLQGTANFYNSLDRFAWDDDTRWDFLNFCYPYLEYVGDCGSTHPQLLNYLKKGYDAQNGLVSNASSSSAASAGGGEAFLEDLSDFEDWYNDKLNELRQIQLDLAESPIHSMAHNAENVNVDDSNIFAEVPAEVNATGLAEGEDEELNSVNASAIQQATAPESRPTTPILSSNPQSGPPSYLGTPAPAWRLGAGGGGGGTLTNFSPGRYSEQSYREANMSQNIQSSSSAASQVGNTPLSQGRRSPTSSVVSAAEGSRLMQQLPIGGGGGPSSSSAATGEATYFGAGSEAQGAVYAVKPAQTESGYEFRLQDPPVGGGGASAPAPSPKTLELAKELISGKARPYVTTNQSGSQQSAKSSKKGNNNNAGFSTSSSSSAAASSEAKPNNRKSRRKTRRARRSTTRRNRR